MIDSRNRVANGSAALVEVDIASSQATQLASAHAGHRSNTEENTVVMIASRVEECPQLRTLAMQRSLCSASTPRSPLRHRSFTQRR
jgi:hypothetical protein